MKKNINPKFDFYTKLLEFLKKDEPCTRLSDEITRIIKVWEYKEQITYRVDGCIPNTKAINLVHAAVHGGDAGVRKNTLSQIVHCAFDDLSPQFRNKAARLLYREWEVFAYDSVHILKPPQFACRKSTYLGERMFAVTIVTNDIVMLRKRLDLPEDPEEIRSIMGLRYS